MKSAIAPLFQACLVVLSIGLTFGGPASMGADEPWDMRNNKPCGSMGNITQDGHGNFGGEATNTCDHSIYLCSTWQKDREPMCASIVPAHGTARVGCISAYERCDGLTYYFK